MADKDQKTVLIIDDQEDSRVLVGKMVEALGLKSCEFGDAKEALTWVEGKEIDVVLLDVMMPGMDGYEFLEKFRTIPGFAETPVFMVTAKDDVLEGYQHGADYYMTKPITTAQLREALKIFLTD